jgi:peptidyl-prolyl cis-trans isomerase SurA
MKSRTAIAGVLAALLMAASCHLLAQAVAPAAPGQPGAAPPLVLDRVIAVVNGDVLLQSDLDQEIKFAALEPFTSNADGDPRKQAMDRLIDRTLVQQQMKNQPGLPKISDDDLKKQLGELRKGLPECAKFACWTDDGWANFCQTHGFTPQEVSDRWRTRLLLLAFIEQRFRTGIRISQPEIEAYYKDEFAPRFKEKNLNAPALASVSQRIQEILLQQRVTALLNDWLKSLHQEGSVQILDPSLADSGGGAAI